MENGWDIIVSIEFVCFFHHVHIFWLCLSIYSDFVHNFCGRIENVCHALGMPPQTVPILLRRGSNGSDFLDKMAGDVGGKSGDSLSVLLLFIS